MPIKTNSIDVGDRKIWAISDIEGNFKRLLYFLVNIKAIKLKGWKIDKSKKHNPVNIQRNDWFTADFEINPNFKDHIVINGDICSNRHGHNHQVVDLLTRIKQTALADNIHIVIGNHETIGMDGENNKYMKEDILEKMAVIKDSKRKMLESKDLHGENVLQSEVNLTSRGYNWLFRHGFNTWDDANRYRRKVERSITNPGSIGNVYDMNSKNYRVPIYARIDCGDSASNISKRDSGYGFFTYRQVEWLMDQFREKNGYKAMYCMGHDKQSEYAANVYAKKLGIVCLDNKADDYFCIQGDKLGRFDYRSGKLKNSLECNSENYNLKSKMNYYINNLAKQKRKEKNNKPVKVVKKTKHGTMSFDGT